MFVIDVYSVITFLVAAYIGSLAIVIYFGSDTPSSKAFAVMAFMIFIWMVAVEGLRATPDQQIAEFLVKFTYYMGSIIAACFFYFAFVFPDDRKPPKYLVPLLISIELLFIPLYYYNLMSIGAVHIGGIQSWGWGFGPLWFLFDIFFNGCFLLGIYSIYSRYKNYPLGEERTRARFMFWGLIIGVVPPSFVNIILPRLGVFEFNWTGPISMFFWTSVIGYSIIKYRQMSVKSVAAEIFVLVMAILLIGNIFADKFTFGAIARVGIFIAFAVMGYLFTKSIIKEAEQKEELKGLNNQLADFNKNLQQKVDEQTVEVKQAYEVEKKARIELEELDKAKDQFILTTQHHLRTPLTIIKGYLQSLLTEKTSLLDEEGKSYLEKASSATDRVAGLVNEFLDVSQMQVGKSILKKESANLRTLVESILGELSPQITKANLQTSLTFPPLEKDNVLNLDKEKLKEALTNLIDNAVKYNQAGGSITIKGERTRHPIERDKEIYRLTIENTGIGLTPEELSQLFTQYFQRGKEAEKLYTTGRGIGLAVTKNIIQAHQGKIYAESGGRGQGARFVVELPV